MKLQHWLQRLGSLTARPLPHQLAAVERQVAHVAQQQLDVQAQLLARLDAIHQQQQSLLERIECQQKELGNLRKQLLDTAKKESLNAVQQIESFLNLQALLDNGGVPLPPMHGWPVSPDLALHLARLVLVERYDLIIEFGSGSSTLVMARVLQQLGSGHLVSFEHLPEYHQQTAALLRECGLFGLVDLQLAPLTLRAGSDGHEYRYYDCDSALAAVADRLRGVPAPKVLVFVDGPPALTGPLARFPALQAVLAQLPQCELHVLLDDYARQDEKDIVKAWEGMLQDGGSRYTHEELPLEKGASLLRIEPGVNARAASVSATERAGP